MKLTLALVLIGTSLTALTLNGIAQNSGGTSSGGGASVGGGTSTGVGVGTSGRLSGGSAGTRGAAQQQLQGGNPGGISGNVNAGAGNADVNASVNADQNQNPNNPNNQNQQQPPPATNAAPGFATAPGTNQGGFNNTNMQPLSPTARAGATNSIYATNTFGSSNGVAPWLQHDQAITATDQALLQQIRQTVLPADRPQALWMSSIHFILKDGAVRLVGIVPTLDERQRIEGLVRQVPGVAQVYNALTVNPELGITAGAGAGNPAAGGSVSGNAGVGPTLIPAPARPTAQQTNAAIRNPPPPPR